MPAESQIPAAPSHAPASGARLERFAAWLSAACAVHCLLFPLSAALLPLLGVSALGALGRSAELALTLAVVAGGGASALLGFRRHRDLKLCLLMVACVLVYLAGHGLEQVWYGRALAIAGGLGLALASFASARIGHAHAPGSCAH